MTGHVDPRLVAEASGVERRALVEHLRACAPCRSAVAAHDPAALFALLAAAPLPREVLDAVSAGVARRTGDDRSSFGSLVASAPATRLRVAAASLAAVLLAGTWLALRRDAATDLAATVPPVVPEVASPAAAPRADVEVHPAQAVSQVVDFTVGETQVVMVYNGDLRL